MSTRLDNSKEPPTAEAEGKDLGSEGAENRTLRSKIFPQGSAASDNSNKRASATPAAAEEGARSVAAAADDDATTAGNRDRARTDGDARRRLVLAGILGALAAACSIGLLGTSAWLISRSAQRPPFLFLIAPAAVVQAFAFGRATLRYGERLAGHDAVLRLLAGHRVSAYDALARLAPAGLADYRSGDLITRLVADIDSLADRWLRIRLPFAAVAVAGIGAVAVESLLSPAAGLVLAATLVIAALAAPAVAIALSRREERQVAPRKGELAAATMELLDGAAELAVFRADGRALAAVKDKQDTVGKAAIQSGYARGAAAAVSALAAGAAVCGAVFFAVPHVRAGSLAGVLLAVVVLIPLAAHEVCAGLVPAAQEIPRLRAAAARLTEIAARPAPATEPTSAAPLPAPPYDLVAHGLTAGWTAGEPVLRDAWFEVPAGTRVAITGPSGSGKTTLAMVLLRFLDYTGGTVTVGRRDIRALAGAQLRTIVGLCEQDAHVFDSTLDANLRLAKPDATAAELRTALAGARLLNWADTLPQGLHTPVGEHGAALSGGQRQRLALARVLLADFPVVILDEPAEHLDEATAADVTRDLLTAVKGRTVLLITHRPVEPGTVDQILRLDRGRLIQA